MIDVVKLGRHFDFEKSSQMTCPIDYVVVGGKAVAPGPCVGGLTDSYKIHARKSNAGVQGCDGACQCHALRVD